MTITTTLDPASIEKLAATFHGRLIVPDDAGYDQARALAQRHDRQAACGDRALRGRRGPPDAAVPQQVMVGVGGRQDPARRSEPEIAGEVTPADFPLV